MKQTAQQLRQQAQKINLKAQALSGTEQHKQQQQAQHLINQAQAQEDEQEGRRKKDLAQIHALAKKAGMDDDTYRDMLEQVTKKRSAAQLSNTERFRVIQHLRRAVPQKKSYPNRPNNADSNAQMGKIEALLAEAKYPWSYAKSIAKQMYKKEQLEFLSSTELTGVINALIKDAKKHGRRVS